MKPIVTTVSGREVNVVTPSYESIDFGDIAHALANTCRFGGHCKTFYSVAQHSVLCSYMASPADKLHMLLHDAAEAYLGDVPSPIKQLLEGFGTLESGLLTAIFGKAGLKRTVTPHTVEKYIDLRMLATEKDALVPHEAGAWEVLKDHEPYDLEILPWTPQQAADSFMHHYFAYQADRERALQWEASL